MKRTNFKKSIPVIILISLSLLILPYFVQAEELYSLKLVNTDKGLAYSSTKIVVGELPIPEIEGTHTAEIKDFSGKTIYQTKFTPKFYQPFDLFLPYYQNGQSVILQDPKQAIPLSISVTHFADTCGNNLCEPQENNYECPSDCQSGQKDDYCDKMDDNLCDPDCQNDEDQDCLKTPGLIDETEPTPLKEIEKKTITKKSEKEPSKFPWWVIFLILLLIFIIIIVIIIIYDKKKHQQKKINEIINYITQYQQAGYNSEQIKSALLKYGYQEKDISKAYQKITTK